VKKGQEKHMRRKRKSGNKYRRKVRIKLTGTSSAQASSPLRAVRFYWAGHKYSNHAIVSPGQQEPATYDLSIRCQARRATPTQVMTELSLAVLISAWMRWLYVRQDKPSKG
jgi:hypothetical protein